MEARKRLLWISLFLFFLFCLLIAQFFRIQIIEGEKWTKAAKSQHQLVVVEPFKRGLFYSNTSIKQGHPEISQPFVIDVPKFHLYADPSSHSRFRRDEVAQSLTKFLKLRKEEQVKLRAQFERKTSSRKLAAWLDRDTVRHDPRLVVSLCAFKKNCAQRALLRQRL